MVIITVILVLAGCTIAQFQSTNADDELDSSKREIFYQAAPLHYVDIGSKLAGDYKFAYDTGKGPMGQSFREETRLADGSVKGSYGIIDENGHQRIFHYSSGKGSILPQTIPKLTTIPFTAPQRDSKLIQLQNYNSFSPQQPIFKPANYLQSRTTRPLKIEPVQIMPQKEIVQKNLKPTEVKKFYTPAQKVSVPTRRINVMPPVFESTTPVQTVPTTTSTTQRPTLSQPQQDTSFTALAEMYKSLKRMPKITNVPTKRSTVAVRRNQVDIKSYESTTEDDYYDSSPAFVDIERLSYSIGTDKSSSV